MHLNTVRLQRMVLAGLIVSMVVAAVVVATFYYFYFSLLRQEAALFGGASIVKVRDAVAEENAGWIAERLGDKQSLPVIAPSDVKDVFDRTRVPGRE